MRRNPEAFGGGGSRPPYRYSYRHSHLWSLHGLGFRPRFTAATTLPYHASPKTDILRFGASLSPGGLSMQAD